MKTAIITGAYGVIGAEIAKSIAMQSYNTILLGRDESRLRKLTTRLQSLAPEVNTMYYPIDLSRKKAIYEFAASIARPIDVLLNNAATAPRTKLENPEGIEMQWSVNVLAYFWMAKAFEGHLRESEHGRIVNVASYWAGGLDLMDPEFKQRPYDNDHAYRQSKQADRMLAYGLGAVFGNSISINACHPGDANSKLSNDLGFGGSESAQQAASTPLYLALSPDLKQMTGAYFTNCREARCQFKSDRGAIRKLMELCESY